ncbi:hypothetical protein [Methylocystis sp. S23]
MENEVAVLTLFETYRGLRIFTACDGMIFAELNGVGAALENCRTIETAREAIDRIREFESAQEVPVVGERWENTHYGPRKFVTVLTDGDMTVERDEFDGGLRLMVAGEFSGYASNGGDPRELIRAAVERESLIANANASAARDAHIDV